MNPLSQIQQLEQQIVLLLNNSGLTVSEAYYLVKSIMFNLEKTGLQMEYNNLYNDIHQENEHKIEVPLAMEKDTISSTDDIAEINNIDDIESITH